MSHRDTCSTKAFDTGSRMNCPECKKPIRWYKSHWECEEAKCKRDRDKQNEICINEHKNLEWKLCSYWAEITRYYSVGLCKVCGNVIEKLG